MKRMHIASKRAPRGGVSVADKANKAMMADPNISNLEDVQRELSAVKAERRRQQGNLYSIPSRRFHVESSSIKINAQCHPQGMDASFAPSISSEAAAGSGEVCSSMIGREGVLTPYVPQTGVPSRLMLMDYVERSDGRLSLCPWHVIGDKVRSLDVSPWDLSTEDTNALCRENRYLSGLKISARDTLDEESLRGLRHVGPQLTSLQVSRCSGVSPQALGTLINDAAQLTYLDLSGCPTMGDEHIARVARECPSVTSVDLSSWLGLTDGGMAAAIRTGGFASLQRLLVSKCSAICDRGLREALDGCLDLKELHAGGCKGVTGRAFLDQELAGGVATAPVRGLRQLNLENCGRLDPSAVEWIAAGCTSLNSLVVSGCFPVTPEGIELLAATPPTLSRLGVSGCVGIDGNSLSFVAERGSDLQHLDISDIPATAAGAVAKFLQNCRRLESIDVSGLPRVDSSSFRGLGRRVNSGVKVCLDSQFVAVPDSREHPSNAIGGATAFVIVDGAELSHLRVARMLRLPNLDNDSVISFANACPHLEDFFLSDSPMVTGACLVPLASLCPLLRSLGLDRCGAATDEMGLSAALQGLPDLRHLGVSREHHSPVPGIPNYSIRDHGSSHGADFRESVRYLVNDRIHSSLDRNVRVGAPVTGETLLAAASRWCKQLTSLGLEGHDFLTFSSDHAPPGAFPCLKELRLAACTAVDDTALLVILEACPRVRTLSVEGSGISQDALLEASSHLSFVQVLPPPHSGSPLATPLVAAEGPRLKCTGKREARSIFTQGDGSSTCLYPPSPPAAAAAAGESATQSAKQWSQSLPQTSARGRIRRNTSVVMRQGAVGLRPTMHYDLHLASAALFSRFKEEDLAANKVVRAWRRFVGQKFQERACAKSKLCRAIVKYWFRTSKRHPDQIRLMDARKAANAIKGRVRSFHLRKRSKAAVGIQSLCRRYVTRCMFLHQQRLRYAATGMQSLWRGYYVRTRFRVREKVIEFQSAKRLIGVKWFKATAAARVPAAVEAEQLRWAQMRREIQRTKAVVQGTLNRWRAGKEAERTATAEQDEEAGICGTLPPAPHREIAQGGFDVKPRATRLRDGRPVHFEGEACNAPGNPSSSCSTSTAGEKVTLEEQKRPRDPADFDVFRRATDDLLGEQAVKQKGLATANRARAEAGGSKVRSDFETSLCGLCRKRFARVLCGDCRLGYCSRCLKRAHAKPERRGHSFHPFERSQKLNSSGSGDAAREARGSGSAKGTGKGSTSKAKMTAATSRSLPDCAARAEAFLKNMSMLKEKEMIKIDEQRAKLIIKNRKEMEEMEAQAREIAEARNRAYAAGHSAAKVIQILYRGYTVRITGRREMEVRRRARIKESRLKLKNAAVRVQALYRGYSVRTFLVREAVKGSTLRAGELTSKTKGGNVVPAPPSLSREEDKATPAARVRRDYALRRRFEREGAIGEMTRLEEELGRLFVDDVQWAMKEQHKSLEDRYGVVKTRRHNARLTWTRLQEERSFLDPALLPDNPERARLAKEIDRQARLYSPSQLMSSSTAVTSIVETKRELVGRKGIRLQHLSNQVEVAEKGLYWCRAFIRQQYRRNASHLASKAGTKQTLAWLEEEMVVVNEVISFASQRVTSVADVVEQEFFRTLSRTWLTDQISRAGKQRLRIDLEQEFVLDAERDRLAKAIEHASRSKGTLQELLRAYDIDAHFMAERCGAELMAAAAEEGTDDEVMWTSRIMRLKSKEEAMRGKLQHRLENDLEEDIAAEEKHLGELVKFTGDVADAPLSHFVEIKASLTEPPHHPHHLSFDSWRKVYITQPWLAAQTQADNKRKAARASTLEELEEMRAVLATAKAQEALAAEEVEVLKNNIAGIEGTLVFDRSTVADDHPDASREPISGDDRKLKELELKKVQEKLVDLEERLGRRKKTNSQKEAELKLKEDGLETDITAEEERHAKQVAAMAAFRTTERGALATQYGKEDADAAIKRMEKCLEKLKASQVDLSMTPAQKQKKNSGHLRSMVGFVLGNDEVEDEENTTQEVDYAEQAAKITKRAKLSVINKQIDDLNKAKKTIAMDYESADAQMMLAEDIINATEEDDEAAVETKKLQARVREAKQRAKDSKEDSKEQKRRLDEEEAKRNAAERKSKNEAAIARRFAEKMGMSSIGKASGMMRGVERLKRKIGGDKITYGGGFDNEKAAMEAAIKAKHTTKLGKVQAVVGFAFTVGTEETDAMISKQARQASQGLPHYRKIAKGLGGKDAVSLWVSKGLDSHEFFTDLYITHADPTNKSYKNLKPNGYVPIGHPKLVAAGRGKPSILLWGKKDPHSDGIADVELSYNEADEKRLSHLGFQVVPGLLSDCGLPDMRFWYTTIKRGAHTLPPMKDILHDLGEVRTLRAQNPSDLALISTEAKLESKLVQAREVEERKAEDLNSPLRDAIEAYALTAGDIEVFIEHFGAMDVERRGTIDAGTFFEYLEWPRNAFANHLFSFMESMDEDGQVDFGDFVKLVCSYCMLGKADLLKYAYTVYIGDKGFVSFDDLMNLLNDLHKTNAGPVQRALREADLDKTRELRFGDFLDLDVRFPKIFYQVANLQVEVRKKFLGETFWERKMHLFQEARENILKSADGSAKKARRARRQQEDLMLLKTSSQRILAATQDRVKLATNRAREKLEKSKWMSKLFS